MRILLPLAAGTLLAACDIVPATNTTDPAPTPEAPSTMTLLRAGDAKICVDPDVEETLRSIMRPEDVDTEAYAITFSATALQAFDPAVTRATCSGNVAIANRQGETILTGTVSYAVLPSAKNPSTFLVWSAADAITQQLRDHAVADQAADQQARETAEQERKLTAIVKPGWLRGRWVQSGYGAQACVDGPFREFAAQNRYSGSGGDGTWGLAGTVVKIERDGASSFFTITNAERDGMSWNDEQDTPTFQRRCTADEIAGVSGGEATPDPAAAPR